MNLLDGREKIMTDSPFNTVAELEAYCDQTVTPILYMSFEMLGMYLRTSMHLLIHANGDLKVNLIP